MKNPFQLIINNFAEAETQVNHFAEYIQGVGPEPLSTLDDAIDAQKIVEATEKSAKEQKSIFLSLD